MSNETMFPLLSVVEDDDLIQVIPAFDLGRATDGKWFARKSQIGGGVTAPLVTYTGTFENPYLFIAASSFGLTNDPDGTITVLTGSWLKSFVYYETGTEIAPLLTLEFDNVVGFENDYYTNLLNDLATLSFPLLQFVGGEFYITRSALLTSISAPVLQTVKGSFIFQDIATLTEINFPALTTVADPIFESYLGITLMPLLTTVSLPSLTIVGGSFTFNFLANLASLTFEALEVVYAIEFNTCAALASVSFPAIRYIKQITCNTAVDALTTFTLGSGLKRVESSISFASCALNQASVDNILVRLAALDGTNGTTSYDNQNVTITGTSAAPSATGVAAAATLTGRGCTVITN